MFQVKSEILNKMYVLYYVGTNFLYNEPLPVKSMKGIWDSCKTSLYLIDIISEVK